MMPLSKNKSDNTKTIISRYSLLYARFKFSFLLFSNQFVEKIKKKIDYKGKTETIVLSLHFLN